MCCQQLQDSAEPPRWLGAGALQVKEVPEQGLQHPSGAGLQDDEGAALRCLGEQAGTEGKMALSHPPSDSKNLVSHSSYGLCALLWGEVDLEVLTQNQFRSNS